MGDNVLMIYIFVWVLSWVLVLLDNTKSLFLLYFSFEKCFWNKNEKFNPIQHRYGEIVVTFFSPKFIGWDIRWLSECSTCIIISVFTVILLFVTFWCQSMGRMWSLPTLDCVAVTSMTLRFIFIGRAKTNTSNSFFCVCGG